MEDFQPCESIRGAAWCGTVEVPENHDDPSGRRIRLRVKILEAMETKTADPVFFLAGGPGQAAGDIETMVIGRFAVRLADRDFVLVDQRGTGGSNPLTCHTEAPNDPTRFFGPQYTEEEIAACLDELAPRADVRLYTTQDFVQDLDAVREKLGYERINVVGGSYGTKAGLVYMRAYPDRVRASVLEGVAPPSFLNPLPAARGSQDALDAFFDACAADAGCARSFPDLARRFDALLARLESDPLMVPVPGSKVSAPLERDALAYLTHILLFNTPSTLLLPRLIVELEQGLTRTLNAVYKDINESLVGGIYFGMQLTVTCTENEPYFATRDLDAATADTYIGRMMVDGVREECTRWPRGVVPPGFYDPVSVDVPTLILSGAADPATPQGFGRDVAAGLPRSQSFLIPNGAHITPHPCTDELVAQFIRTGGTETLDGSCLAEIPRPPFQVATMGIPGR